MACRLDSVIRRQTCAGTCIESPIYPCVEWGTQEMMKKVKRSALKAVPSSRTVQLCQPVVRGKHVSTCFCSKYRNFYLPITEVPKPALVCRSNSYLTKLATPKIAPRVHRSCRPQYSHLSGEDCYGRFAKHLSIGPCCKNKRVVLHEDGPAEVCAVVSDPILRSICEDRKEKCVIRRKEINKEVKESRNNIIEDKSIANQVKFREKPDGKIKVRPDAQNGDGKLAEEEKDDSFVFEESARRESSDFCSKESLKRLSTPRNKNICYCDLPVYSTAIGNTISYWKSPLKSNRYEPSQIIVELAKPRLFPWNWQKMYANKSSKSGACVLTKASKEKEADKKQLTI